MTNEGVKITVHSAIELIQYLLNQGVPYVLTERFCQDPSENYFGRQRVILATMITQFVQPNCLDRLLEIVAMMIHKLRLCLAAPGTNNSPHQSPAQ